MDIRTTGVDKLLLGVTPRPIPRFPAAPPAAECHRCPPQKGGKAPGKGKKGRRPKRRPEPAPAAETPLGWEGLALLIDGCCRTPPIRDDEGPRYDYL